MTPKERAAMQQALEALHNTQNALLFVSGSIEQFTISKMTADAHDDADKAITALREALGNSLKPKCFADYQPNHAIDRACASCPVAAECQTGEQAEQEPVAWIKLNEDGVYIEDVTGFPVYAAPVQPVKQEPDDLDWITPEAVFEAKLKLHGIPNPPVQQVDLTDDEIERALDAAKVPELPDGYKSVDLEIARAVIQEYRRKNGIV